VIPDLNSTVEWSAKTVIFSMSFLTIALSNSVMSVYCPAMKSSSFPDVFISEYDMIALTGTLTSYPYPPGKK